MAGQQERSRGGHRQSSSSLALDVQFFIKWRRYVKRKKARGATVEISKQLFLLHPVFQRAILRIRFSAWNVREMRLQDVKQGLVYNLDMFVSTQEGQMGKCRSALEFFSEESARVVTDACESALRELEKRLLGEGTGGADDHHHGSEEEGRFGEEDAWDHQGEDGNHVKSTDGPAAATQRMGRTAGATNDLATTTKGQTVRPNGAAAAVAAAIGEVSGNGTDFSYAVTAAKRSEQRRLLSFVRMVDFLVQETLRDLLHDSLRDFLAVIKPAAPPAENPADNAVQGGQPGEPSRLPDQQGGSVANATCSLTPTFLSRVSPQFLRPSWCTTRRASP